MRNILKGLMAALSLGVGFIIFFLIGVFIIYHGGNLLGQVVKAITVDF